MPAVQLIIASAVMAAGSMLHGSVGFGMAMIAAPLLLLLNPELVPAPIILCAGVLVVSMLWRERSALDFREVSWAVVGSVIGTAAAAVLLAYISQRTFMLVFGSMLLAIVAINMIRWRGQPGRWIILGAGFLSGLMGTTTSVGGPPMALVYQNADPVKLRSMLAAFAVAGFAFAVAGLMAAGKLGLREVVLAGYLVPGTLLGFILSNYTRHWLKPGFVRPAVLLLSGLAAVAILARYFTSAG